MSAPDSELEFANKVVLITGSSSGLGAQMAREFAKRGAQVVITGRNQDRVCEVAESCDGLSPLGLIALQVVADVTKDEDVRRLVGVTVDNYGQLDVLVNNAGAGSFGTLDNPKLLDQLDHMFKLDVRSVVQLTQLAAPHLEKTKGAIVNVSSVCGVKPRELQYAGCSAYCMAKTSIDMFTKCISLELGPKGIRVNVINPTAVRTGFQENSGAGDVFNGFVAHLEQTCPLGKLPEPVDIANAVLFLASSKSAFITGVALPVDCGTLLEYSNTRHREPVVPNTVHYILFTVREIQFAHFLSILSVLRNHRPDLIYIHCDCHRLSGKYFQRVSAILPKTNTRLIVRRIEKPTHIFSHKLRPEWSDWHGSDLTRLRLLAQYGGVYLDTDVYVVKPLHEFFHYDFTVDFQVPYVMLGNQVLIARANATALDLWIGTYRYYDPDSWYYNAGELPVRLVMNERPELVHRLNGEFGAQGTFVCSMLYYEYHGDWRAKYYAVHMAIRDDLLAPTGQNDPYLVNTPYCRIIRWPLFDTDVVALYANKSGKSIA
ncbi:unnamed protein product, partial [Oppiella nova]